MGDKKSAKQKAFQKKRGFKLLKRRRKRASKRKSIDLSILIEKVRNEEIIENFNVLVAPVIFSFVDNTNEVLNYFNAARQSVNRGRPVFFNISNIEELSADSIALLMAHLNERKSRRAGFGGDAPQKEKLQRMFRESGIYDYVTSMGKKEASPKNKLWKHSSDNQVQSIMAGQAMEMCKKVLPKSKHESVLDPLYNLLIEAMSNTINHASPENIKDLNWCLYTYTDEFEKCMKYCFVDLGVGIFKSANFKAYRRTFSNIFQGTVFLVKALFKGDLYSSRETDNDISGKGIKQILSCAEIDEFKRLIIITNDVRIDIKARSTSELSNSFNGTCIYWEVNYV